MLPEAKKLILDARNALGAAMEFGSLHRLDDYLADLMLRSAVERQLFIAGEALSQLSRVDQSIFDQIVNAQRIVSFRHLLAHGYAAVDDERVWVILTEDAPVTYDELGRFIV